MRSPRPPHRAHAPVLVFPDGLVPVWFLLNDTTPEQAEQAHGERSGGHQRCPQETAPAPPPAAASFPGEGIEEANEEANEEAGATAPATRRGQKKTPYECEVCHKVVLGLYSLRRHMITHTDLYPFSCDKCGQRFRAKAAVKRHQSVHTGEKPFACSWPGCDYRCAQQSDINTHMRVHTREQPFQCLVPGCGKRFGYRKALVRHKRRFHQQL